MIKVIAFDLDDTLWAVKPVIIRAEKILNGWLQNEAPDLNFSVDEMRVFRESILAQEPALAGKLTELRRRVIESALLQSRFSAVEARRISTQAMEIFLQARNEIELFDGALDTLRTLGESYILGALSNGNADIQRIGLAHLFDFAFSAESVGAPKPAPHLFQAALTHTGVSPHQMVYVGDDPTLDVDAAKSLGLKSIWLNHGVKEPGVHNPDQEISHITQLPGAINRLRGLPPQ